MKYIVLLLTLVGCTQKYIPLTNECFVQRDYAGLMYFEVLSHKNNTLHLKRINDNRETILPVDLIPEIYKVDCELVKSLFKKGN